MIATKLLIAFPLSRKSWRSKASRKSWEWNIHHAWLSASEYRYDTKIAQQSHIEFNMILLLVRLYEHFNSARYIYLIIELCPGGDLSKYIKRLRRIDERTAQGFLRQLSDGLYFLNQKNLIHRDLKPANVLLSEASDCAILKVFFFLLQFK